MTFWEFADKHMAYFPLVVIGLVVIVDRLRG